MLQETRKNEAARKTREEEVKETGYPAYTTQVKERKIFQKSEWE